VQNAARRVITAAAVSSLHCARSLPASGLPGAGQGPQHPRHASAFPTAARRGARGLANRRHRALSFLHSSTPQNDRVRCERACQLRVQGWVVASTVIAINPVPDEMRELVEVRQGRTTPSQPLTLYRILISANRLS
jgi:hypothetical protein